MRTEEYIYVCYPIKKITDKLIGHYDYKEAESFTAIENAAWFMKQNYAQYVMAVEKCDQEVYKSVKKYEAKNGNKR